MKKIMLTFLVLCTIMSNVCVYADNQNILGGGTVGHVDTANMTEEEIIASYEVAAALPRRSRNDISLMRSYTTVTVNAVCDSEWVTALSATGIGGLDAAELIIDKISEKVEDWVGVRLYGYAINATTLNQTGTNGKAYVDEAWAEYGLGTRDMMIAFYKNYFNLGGWAYYGEPKCALFFQSYDFTWQCGRHETGHMYDVYYEDNMINADIDGDCLEECVMNDYPYDYYNMICDDCLDIWTENSDLYPQ